MKDIVPDYRHGLSVYALAAKYQAHRSVIAKHLGSRGVEFRPTVLSSEITKALALHEQGHRPKRIGLLLGRDLKTVRSLLRRTGLQPRRRHSGFVLRVHVRRASRRYEPTKRYQSQAAQRRAPPRSVPPSTRFDLGHPCHARQVPVVQPADCLEARPPDDVRVRLVRIEDHGVAPATLVRQIRLELGGRP